MEQGKCYNNWKIMNETIILTTLLVGIHFTIMTVIGNMKDSVGDERSLVNEWGRDSIKFRSLYSILAYSQLVVYVGVVGFNILGIVWGVAMTAMCFNAREKMTGSPMTRSIAMYELVSMIAFVYLVSLHVPTQHMFSILGVSALWGLGVQWFLYGDPLYFP